MEMLNLDCVSEDLGMIVYQEEKLFLDLKFKTKGISEIYKTLYSNTETDSAEKQK